MIRNAGVLLLLCIASCFAAAQTSVPALGGPGSGGSSSGFAIPFFWRGGDISYIPEIESEGGRYFDADHFKDPVKIFASHGMNVARLRVWVNPSPSWCDQAHTYAMAKRIAAAGMQLVIDFHYSDTWADPGHQTTPAAWTSLDHAHLVNEVYQYTEAFISGLVAQGTPPMAVQIGNEITNGMLWPDGYLDGTSGQWQNFADLVNAGIAGVRAAQGSRYISVMIHIDRGGDNAGAESFFDNLIAYGVQFDVIGLSYYVWWQGPISDMESNTWALALRYVKPIVIAETMYPSTLNLVGDWSRWVTEDSQIDSRFPASAAGQGSYVESVMSTIADLPMGLGLGTLYWAPEGIDDPVNTQPFDNLVLFDFYGNELSSMEAMGGQFSFTTSASDVNNRGQLYATITIPFPDPLGKTSFGLFSADPTLIGVPSRARFTSGQTTWTVPLTVGAASKPTEVPIFVYRCGTAKACTVTVHPN